MYQFTIHAPLTPQKQTQWTRSGIAYDPSKKDKERIQWQIRPTAPQTPLAQPVELTLVFFFPIPKGTSKALRTQMLNRVILPAKRPDLDNLAYLVTNALKGIVYDDDSRVCALLCYKFYGAEPKTVIKVRPILEAEPLGYREMDNCT